MRLSLHRFETGVETIGGNRVVYDLDGEIVRFGAAKVDGPALVWQLDHDEVEAGGALVSHFVQLDPFASWVVRCDLVEFSLGAVLPRHAQPGPGIRYLLRGELEIEVEGRASFYGPGAAWFESGTDPVLVHASTHLGASCVRTLVLPSEWAGKRTERFVEPGGAIPPGTTTTVLLEHAIALPR